MMPEGEKKKQYCKHIVDITMDSEIDFSEVPEDVIPVI
jgi:hypothetical protein